MSKKLKQQLKIAFEAPGPTRKSQFLRDLSYPKASVFETLLCQIGYIRKRFWCLSILVMIGLLATLKFTDYGYEKISLLSSIMPLFTIIGVSEISKSISYNMKELEMSCKYNLQKITLLRISFIGSFYFVIFLILALTFAKQSQFGVPRSVLYSITPFLLSSYLSIWVINHVKIKDTVYVCAGVTGFISVGILIITTNTIAVYAPTFNILWGMIFVILTLLLLHEIRNLMKQTEELQCHSLLID